MTTPTGQISLDDVNIELSIAPGTQINMNAAPVRGLAGVPTGQISMSNLQGKSNAQYVAATGGTITTSGDYKIHTFTSSGTFTVTNAGNPAGSNSVEYVIVAGGGGGEGPFAGGAGAGGFLSNFPSPATGGVPVSVTGYPIAIGGGGSSADGTDTTGLSLTVDGGGKGGNSTQGSSGGSGAGSARGFEGPGGAGNTPPRSAPATPTQGSPGGNQNNNINRNGGGGGATQAGDGDTSGRGDGGDGRTTNITGSSATYAGGGAGGTRLGESPQPVGGAGGGGPGGGGNFSPQGAQAGTPGSANTGGGGGGSWQNSGGSGGSGRMIIRYKFQ